MLIGDQKEINEVETIQPKDGETRYLEALIFTVSTFYAIGKISPRWGIRESDVLMVANISIKELMQIQ